MHNFSEHLLLNRCVRKRQTCFTTVSWSLRCSDTKWIWNNHKALRRSQHQKKRNKLKGTLKGVLCVTSHSPHHTLMSLFPWRKPEHEQNKSFWSLQLKVAHHIFIAQLIFSSLSCHVFFPHLFIFFIRSWI